MGNRKDSLTLQEHVLSRKARILVNTGATCSLVNLAGTPARMITHLQRSVWLTTATGRRRLGHGMLVADVTYNIILGLDFLHRYNISLDLGTRVFWINNKKLPTLVRLSLPNRCSSPAESLVNLRTEGAKGYRWWWWKLQKNFYKDLLHCCWHLTS